MIEEAELADIAICATMATPKGHLRIGTPVAFARFVLEPLMNEFLPLYPELSVQIELLHGRDQQGDEGFDLVVRAGPLARATGNVGREFTAQLLAAGKQVRVFARDPSKVVNLKGLVEVAVGDLTQVDTFVNAVAGVEGIFLMNSPLDGETFRSLSVAKASGNPRLVFLSSMFAAYPDSLIGQMHRDKEDVIRASGLPHIFVRAGAFMTNTFWWLGTIKTQGMVYDSTGQGKSAPVAPQDIASLAVEGLTIHPLQRSWKLLEVNSSQRLSR